MDRNSSCWAVFPHCRQSPPARVAWIETQLVKLLLAHLPVATREGGVDRNYGDIVATEGWREGRHPRGWRG